MSVIESIAIGFCFYHSCVAPVLHLRSFGSNDGRLRTLLVGGDLIIVVVCLTSLFKFGIPSSNRGPST